MKQISKNLIKLDGEELDKNLARRMIEPYYFSGENLKISFKINLESHIINHAFSILYNMPKYKKLWIEIKYITKILKEMATIYARLIYQNKFKYHIFFSASFYKTDEKDQRSDEIELFINLNINHKLGETDVNNLNVKSQLEHQNQIQETKKSGWIVDKINSMKTRFLKNGELNDSSFV